MLAQAGGSLCRAPTAMLAPLGRALGMEGFRVQCHAARAGLHPRSGVSHCVRRDTASKVCGEQTATPLWAQGWSAAAGVPPGVPRDLPWSREWHINTSWNSDPGQHRPELQTC